MQPQRRATAAPYALRNAADRLRLGASSRAEAGKPRRPSAAALKWLANRQSADGRWDASQFGAGDEMQWCSVKIVAEQGPMPIRASRRSHFWPSSAPATRTCKVNTRTTSAAASISSLRSPAADGSLFGDATLYAQMYCHSMATFALAEALAVTGDHRLEPAVRRAVNYSLARAKSADRRLALSHPATRATPANSAGSSWRSGSAERAGIAVPTATWTRRRSLPAYGRAAAAMAAWPAIDPTARPARR